MIPLTFTIRSVEMKLIFRLEARLTTRLDDGRRAQVYDQGYHLRRNCFAYCSVRQPIRIARAALTRATRVPTDYECFELGLQ